MTSMLTRLLDIEEWSAEASKMDASKLDGNCQESAFQSVQRARKYLEIVERKLLDVEDCGE